MSLVFIVSWLISSWEGYWKPFEFVSQLDGPLVEFQPFQELQSSWKGRIYLFAVHTSTAQLFFSDWQDLSNH